MEKVLVYYKMKDNSNISEYKTVGNYEANSDYITLEFKEKDTGINSKYYIYDDKLVLHRNGSIEMILEFVLNKERTLTSNLYCICYIILFIDKRFIYKSKI